MKTISTVRFRPKLEYFDLVADKLKERAEESLENSILKRSLIYFGTDNLR